MTVQNLAYFASDDSKSEASKIDALNRLLRLAHDDTGGAKRAAQYLLSLWNGSRFKADLQDLLYVDPNVFNDMQELTKYLHRNDFQLDSLLAESEIVPIIDLWGDTFREKE